MLVLLGVSTLAAALAPVPDDPRPTTGSAATGRTSEAPARGELVRAGVEADAGRPQTVRASTGDQLVLTVRSRRYGQIQIPGLGLSDHAAPLSPARFDILVSREGCFQVRRMEPKTRLALLDFRAEARKSGGREECRDALTSESGRRAGRSAGASR